MIVKEGLAKNIKLELNAKRQTNNARVMPRGLMSQPEINELAIERTSGGERGISKEDAMAEAPARMLVMVLWRASTVKMEPAASRVTESLIKVAPPR